jgi:23S rRNA (cytidine1920-2'-O)/16S rRNA (cytidine1409-2'-O)-methyltransferase
MAGMVEVEGRRLDKPGTAVAATVALAVREREPYVSRAGRKLAAALEHFDLAPRDWVCLDVGASTGGFTDCLLQAGARLVYAIDVGYGQLDQRLRQDPRVVVMERTNARYLDPASIGESVRLATADLSFISLTKVIPAILPVVEPDGLVLTLVKPQFEAGRELVGKGGIVRDGRVRRQVVEQTVKGLSSLGLIELGVFDSPLAGAKGNRETFALLRKGVDQ